MRWGIRRIFNGCARQLLVASRDAIAPEFISYEKVIRATHRKVCRRMPNNLVNCDIALTDLEKAKIEGQGEVSAAALPRQA